MKLYCPVCKRLEDDNGIKRCPVCNVPLHKSIEYTLVGEKGELPFMNVEVKETSTWLCLTDADLHIKQTVTWFDVIKRPSTSLSISCADIQAVETYYRWDWWDLAIAGGITLLTQVNHWLWLLVILLFLYLGAGRVIAIHYKNGSVWRIPIGVLGKGSEAYGETFVAELQKRMPKGVL